MFYKQEEKDNCCCGYTGYNIEKLIECIEEVIEGIDDIIVDDTLQYECNDDSCYCKKDAK